MIDWGTPHVVWFALTSVALVLAAYQWDATFFRALAIVAALTGVFMTVIVGRNVLLDDRIDQIRTTVTSLDRRVADLTRQAELALAAAKKKGARQIAAAEPADKAEARAAAKQAERQAKDAHHRRLELADEAQKAVTAACALVSSDKPAEASQPEACASPISVTGKNTTEIGVSLSTAALGIATLNAHIAADEASQTALVSAQADLAEAQVAMAQGDVEGVSVAESLVAGARSAVESVPLANAEPPVPWQLTGLAWVLLLLLLVLAYRWLEILNAGLTPGPVAFDVGDSPKPEFVQIKTVLLQNFDEPGLHPGAAASTSITDLAALDEQGGKIAKAVLGLLNATAFPARGYQVKATITETTPPTVVLTITSRRAGTTKKVISESAPAAAPSSSEVARRAGLRAAAWILAQSRGVPPWLQAPPDGSVHIEPLASVIPDGPGFGDVDAPRLPLQDWGHPAEKFVALGNACDLQSRPGPAALYYALALHMWPDYALSRYRLAASLSAAAEHDEVRNWLSNALTGPLGAITKKDVLPPSDGQTPPISNLQQADLRSMSKTHLDRVLLEAYLLPIRRLSIRERASAPRLHRWLPTVRLIREARRVGDDAPPALNRTFARNASVAYNQACQSARHVAKDAKHADLAAAGLAQALTSPGAASINKDWVAVDPDLDNLRRSQVWGALQEQFGLPIRQTMGSASPNAVTVVGDLQATIGASYINWDPLAGPALTRDAPSGLWFGFFLLPPGEYRWKIAVNHGWEENYGAGGALSGPPTVDDIELPVDEGGTYLFLWNEGTHVPSARQVE